MNILIKSLPFFLFFLSFYFFFKDYSVYEIDPFIDHNLQVFFLTFYFLVVLYIFWTLSALSEVQLQISFSYPPGYLFILSWFLRLHSFEFHEMLSIGSSLFTMLSGVLYRRSRSTLSMFSLASSSTFGSIIRTFVHHEWSFLFLLGHRTANFLLLWVAMQIFLCHFFSSSYF